MSTYNGQCYLAEQLNSISAQTHQNWELWVSDDGSDDDTSNILEEYQTRYGKNRVFIYSGPQKGVSANFLSLVCNTKAVGEYFAFSDQDDIWAPNKLQHAIECLKTIPNKIPALYCARTKLINQVGAVIGSSPLFKKEPIFLNALVQNVAGGNTMLFNKATLNLLRAAGENVNVVIYDWWVYLLVTGAGGEVFYDAFQTLYYRQHQNNLIGSNDSWRDRYKRVFMLFKGRFKQYNAINIQALLSIQHLLTKDNKMVLNKFIAAREKALFSRLKTIYNAGIYKQTFLGNIGLITAALFNKI